VADAACLDPYQGLTGARVGHDDGLYRHRSPFGTRYDGTDFMGHKESFRFGSRAEG
jgi:hypothetical protein